MAGQDREYSAPVESSSHLLPPGREGIEQEGIHLNMQMVRDSYLQLAWLVDQVCSPGL
jgi:hypothetical protein